MAGNGNGKKDTRTDAEKLRSARLELQQARTKISEYKLKYKVAWKLNQEYVKKIASLEEQVSYLNRLSFKDELTGIGNLRALRADMERLANLHPDALLTFMLFDIDNFKGVNDTYGHDAGDKVLSHIASLLEVAMRPFDIIYRYGGDEFVILGGPRNGKTLAEVDLREVTDAAERYCDNVSTFDWSSLNCWGATDENPQITISLGVSAGVFSQAYAVYSAENARAFLDQLKKEADKPLYRAKQAGRNQMDISTGIRKRPDFSSDDNE